MAMLVENYRRWSRIAALSFVFDGMFFPLFPHSFDSLTVEINFCVK